MSARRARRLIGLSVLIVGLATTLVGCIAKATVHDPAGATLLEVESLSLEEQYEKLHERYDRSQELMLGVRLAVSDAQTQWRNTWSGRTPMPGTNGHSPLAGGTDANTYYLAPYSVFYPESARAIRADLEPALRHFESQGWEPAITRTAAGWNATTKTEDGFLIRYAVKFSGQYAVDITSGSYWGDTEELGYAMLNRVPRDAPRPEYVLPGDTVPFPKWTDPIVDDLGSDTWSPIREN